jgi:hypothetical protein
MIINEEKILSQNKSLVQQEGTEALVISQCYEMGDPLAPSKCEENREGAGVTRQQLFEMTRL